MKMYFVKRFGNEEVYGVIYQGLFRDIRDHINGKTEYISEETEIGVEEGLEEMEDSTIYTVTVISDCIDPYGYELEDNLLSIGYKYAKEEFNSLLKEGRVIAKENYNPMHNPIAPLLSPWLE